MRTGRPLLDVVWTGVPPPSTLLAPPCFANPTKRCDWRAQPAIIRGVPPHWVNEPHQELAPAVLEVAGSFFPPTPPRAPPSQVDGMTSSQKSLAGPPYGADIQHYVPPLLLAGWRAPPTALFSSPAPPPALCVPTRPSLGMILSSSFSLVILTLRSAGCLCSALVLRRWSALEDWILTASVFCLVKDFL